MNTRLTSDQQRRILYLARVTIADRLAGVSVPARDDEPWLREPGAAFVTLRVDGQLNGCIGSLEPRRPLGDDVRANALSAAFTDPRFPALRADQLDRVVIEVSVLSPLEGIVAHSETEALAQIRPGEDGLLIVQGTRRGTLLPQMWEQLPDRTEFLAHVKRKAGLPPLFWDDETKLYRYSVFHCAERDPHATSETTA